MRYFRCPPPVTIPIIDPATGKPLQKTMAQTVEDSWLNHSSFGKNLQALRQALKISLIFADKNPGDIIALEDADYAALKFAIENQVYNPVIGRLSLPHADAVLAATTDQTAL